jgi:3',5'-cyclic AMP phosphodiesterase CpdA
MDGRRLLGFGLTLVLWLGGCPRDPDPGTLLPARDNPASELDGYTLVLRLAHVTDTHIVDTLSPARFAGAHQITRSAWRPYEAYATQLFDGIVRMVNRIHASGRTVDFLVHTGDAVDNVQSNELDWFLDILEGGQVDPLSGPDDRPADARPAPTLDPYAAFDAQGLYQHGRHGDLPSIPWYAVLGNHEVYAIGVFAIFADAAGRRTAPLPLDFRPGLLLPVRLDPVGSVAHGSVTPADPGPPRLLEPARYVEPRAERAFFDKPAYVEALWATSTGPPGHGSLGPSVAETWYSAAPAPGVRLIGLDTTDRAVKIPGYFYDMGAMSRAQLAFLSEELEHATELGQLVIVASHHPSAALAPHTGNEVAPAEFRALLQAYPCVVLHVCGHSHRNRVWNRGSYIEIETCSTLDLPQEGRLVEIWRSAHEEQMAIAYEMFAHIDDTLPALGSDRLRALRERAHAVASADKDAPQRLRRLDPADGAPHDTLGDRAGVAYLRR